MVSIIGLWVLIGTHFQTYNRSGEDLWVQKPSDAFVRRELSLGSMAKN